jgi:hypothetical protein
MWPINFFMHVVHDSSYDNPIVDSLTYFLRSDLLYSLEKREILVLHLLVLFIYVKNHSNYIENNNGSKKESQTTSFPMLLTKS